MAILFDTRGVSMKATLGSNGYRSWYKLSMYSNAIQCSYLLNRSSAMRKNYSSWYKHDMHSDIIQSLLRLTRSYLKPDEI